ncbi:MAG: hypothetical protein WCJ54_07885, partial [Actinomycetota bacterium]
MNAAADPKEVVFDADCSRVIITGVLAARDATGKPICNLRCAREVLYDQPDYITKNGKFCEYGSETKQGVYIPVNCKLPISPYLPATACAAEKFLPDANYPILPSQDDSIMIYIRGGIYAVMGVVSLGVILMGMYGWYLRAMSEGNPEKVAASMKVYQNTII